jgi:crotonobetainyl-CoA:carnitine CoA-transferase CaiB-like acyl-CoA transferase
MGSAQPLNAPYQAFETADGRIVIGGSHQNNRLNTEGVERRAARAALCSFRSVS